MSVGNLGSVYSFEINSMDDIDRLINEIDDVNMVVSNIIIERQLHIKFEIGGLFKKAYWGSLGFSTCPEVVRGIDRYHVVLRDAFVVCNDVLPPLFIRSFKCHQTALRYYAAGGQQESAMSAMAETGEIVNRIAGEYNRLSERFSRLFDKEGETVVALVRDRQPLCIQEREGREKEKEESIASDSLQQHFRRESISSLESAISSIGKIRAALGNMKIFWRYAERHCKSLADPCLADPDMIAVMGDVESRRAGEEFCSRLRESGSQLDPKPEKGSVNEGIELLTGLAGNGLTEVVKSMRTGRDPTISNAVHRAESVDKLVESILLKGIEGEFERSYLNWLALAKVNLEVTSAIRTAIVEVEENQNDILQTERDPLAIALHAAALNDASE